MLAPAYGGYQSTGHGETVAEHVRRRSLHHTGVPDGHVDGPLDRLLVDVMALDNTR
jgi:hypothetical protein